MRRVVRIILSALLFALPVTAAQSDKSVLAVTDQKAIRATIEAYRTSWLSNDESGVLRTFADDAVLLPAHGGSPIVGIAAIKKYWFTPGGPPTTITRLDITVDEVSGNATLAYARGQDNVGWTVSEQQGMRRHYHPGTYLNVMKKQADGSWKIQVHMWDDGKETVE